MAATERTGFRALSRKVARIKGLPILAAGVGVLSGRVMQAQSFVDFRTLSYQEDGGRTRVLNPTVLVHQELAPSIGIFDLHLQRP